MSLLNEGLTNYLKKINEAYSRQENQSLSDILNTFSQISKDYKDISSDDKNIEYSNADFSKCTRDEQLSFYVDQLQLIECLVTNTIYEKQGMVWNWGKIFKLLLDKEYSGVEKIARKVVYSTSSNQRPIGDMSYNIWNGLQIIDLDIKDEKLSERLKPLIFDELSKYQWFLGICKSASKKSLHIWTKITPISIDQKNRRVEYICNFRHKYSYVYVVLLKYSQQFGYDREDIFKYMDMAMCKPQQGIFISSDSNAKLNTNFNDTRLDVNFEAAFSTGISSINWISHPDLKDIFHKLEWFNLDNKDISSVDISDISDIDKRDISKSLGKRHYKHNQRWQLANTLTALYGEDEALKIMCSICEGTPRRELAGDVKTAAIHSKPLSIWAVKELNKQHGFNIKVKSDEIVKNELEILDDKMKNEDNTIDPTKILNDNMSVIKLHMKHNQYLSDIKEDIIKNLGNITLLEAGAGYGKTEMIKALKSKTLLILPFTSTIKAKVESSDTTKDWLYFYGNKRPSLDDVLGDRNMSMTIDKFSRLNVFELEQADFKYIVIDESHLLFTSSYRDVMSPCIQRLANLKNAKIIMMTGTPTGEMLFFPGIRHIKVEKEDYRKKELEIHMVPTKTEKLIEMARSMAYDINDGKKILYPTNKGNLYFEQITGLIQDVLTKELKSSKILKAFYYKKSNYGEDSMDHINIDKSIGDNDLIGCTTYLSVGVDICDRYTFSVYFNETWIPQDIEQFANRLRNNDLFLKMFLEKEDSTGVPINYYHTQPLDLSFNQKDLLLARDLIQTCNDMLERNAEESKYNPLISSLLTANKYLKYDENDCRYYIDETTYKLRVFEERYSEYSKQLNVLINGMKYYGYDVTINDHTERIPEEKLEEVEEYMKNCRNVRYNYNTIQTLLFLDHLNDGNIDIYRELLKGSYDIFKDDKFAIDRVENNLYAKDIEVLEKNIPIVVGLYKFYDCETIKEIFEYCIDKKLNKINYSKLNRIRKFVNIEYNIKKKKLDFPILKFVKAAQEWAKANRMTTTTDIRRWVANFTASYANSIRDIVIDDNEFLENLYEMITELWKVVIIETKPKNGNVTISPFQLLWEKKTDLTDMYGGSSNTKEFFLQELIYNMKEDNIEEELPELPKTPKKKLDDVIVEIPNIVHKSFDYYEYSEEDSSNERFMRKQENTNSLRDTLFSNIENNEQTTIKTDPTLFDDMPF